MITFYTTGCPKCKVLKAKLLAKNIRYIENTSVEKMVEIGITQVPVLKVGDSLLSYSDSIKWVNEQGGN